MTADEIRLIRYTNVDTRRFSFWLIFKDNRKVTGKKANRDLIKFFESNLGKLGEHWHFDAQGSGTFIIKADKDLDVTMMLLKYNK